MEVAEEVSLDGKGVEVDGNVSGIYLERAVDAPVLTTSRTSASVKR